MSRKRLTLALNIIVVMVISVSAARANQDWPLRNGNFSKYARPNHPFYLSAWRVQMHPALQITFEEYGDRKNAQLVNLKAAEPGRAVIYQDLYLPAGEYRFTIFAKISKEANLQIIINDSAQTFYDKPSFEQLALNFKMASPQNVRIHLLSTSRGEIRLKEAQIDIIKIVGSQIPLESGEMIGSIVLPDAPNEAEQYACFELQKYISKMTGKAPGLEGRDDTFSGKKIKIMTNRSETDSLFYRNVPSDSYLIKNERDIIILAGVNPIGTLYAVYDFLKQQGCGWYWPGEDGEVVPQIDKLKTPYSKFESPDWDVRGIFNHQPKMNVNGVWLAVDRDEYIDWAVRNRLNAAWLFVNQTVDFGDYRGNGRLIHTGHSYSSFWFTKDGPIMDYAPLVNGVKKPRHSSGRPNQPCLANPDFRRRTVELILEYFKNNPRAEVFGVSADDEPADWCECPECRKLDPDNGLGEWKVENSVPAISMTDRALDYVNYVAESVSKVYPDKKIEMYCYGSVRNPPQKIKVHPNVLVKYCYWPSTPIGISLRDRRIDYNKTVLTWLEGWRLCGAKHFGLYDYGNYYFPDAACFWFWHIADSMKVFKEDFDFEHYLGENDSNFKTSMMLYNIRAELLWDKDADYKQIIDNVCRRFYGQAGDVMSQYYRYMDNVGVQFWSKDSALTNQETYSAEQLNNREGVLMGDPNAWYSALFMTEWTLSDIQKGYAFIDQAWSKVVGNDIYEKRLAYADFGHNYKLLVFTELAKNKTIELRKSSKKAFDRCRYLFGQYNILVDRFSYPRLVNWYFPPIVSRKIADLPVVWSFKLDPNNEGLTQEWHKSDTKDWQSIRVDNFWTRQGFEYHGVAWYSLEFSGENWNITDQTDNLALLFEAVDGTADIFLDGQKIGEQKEPVEFMWDKSFAIKLPDGFKPAQKHRLVVRVEKQGSGHEAGIWKPISVVAVVPSE